LVADGIPGLTIMKSPVEAGVRVGEVVSGMSSSGGLPALEGTGGGRLPEDFFEAIIAYIPSLEDVSSEEGPEGRPRSLNPDGGR